MTDSTQIVSHYSVDDLEIDAGTREVRRGAKVLDLPGLTFDLLLALVRAAPNVLGHDDLEELVWGGRPVSPETMTQRVKLVRDALGDATDSPRYIAVVRGHGYRLVAAVKAGAETSRPQVGRRAILISALALILAVVLVVNFTNRSETPKTIEVMAPELPSIAVLFFDDLSENKDQEYFSNGMSETLIRELAQVTGLKVIAKTSSFYYKDKEVRISDIASELQVGHVLEGSVQKAGDRVRVTAQLIDVSDNSSVWSKNFDRDLVDLFAVQDEIAREVVEALKVSLLDREAIRLAQRYRPSLEAYEQVILGRQEMEMGTAESLATAERHFQRAIAIDPGYAPAYVDLANTYNFQVNSSGLLMEDSIERRQLLIEKALELDPFSGEVYAARALLHLDHVRRKYELAESDYLKAIELKPNYATAYQWYSTLLRRQGRFEEALTQIQVAAELDPIAPYVQTALASVLWVLGRVEEAQTVTRRNIDRHPGLPTNYSMMADYQTALGHEGEAQRWHDEVRKRNPQAPQAWQLRCAGFLHLGDLSSAENCVHQLSEFHPESLQTFFARHWLLVYRGEYGAAIANHEAILERLPGRPIATGYMADLIAEQGDLEHARRLMADVLPEFLENEVELTATDLGSALTFAAILHANGETKQRDVLLLAMEARIATTDRIRGDGYGILDVYIHAMRGDRGRAIAALREAIDVGWKVTSISPRMYWWQLRSDWRLESLHQDPEFIALVNELEADIAVQRQWYEENKGRPLDSVGL